MKGVKTGAQVAELKAQARKRKLRAIRTRRRLRLLGIALIAAIAALGAWALYNSHLFDIKEIEVRGNVRLAKDDIVDLSGVKKGQSLLKISTGEVVDRVHKSPWVRSVRVTRRPPKTIEIEVAERQPFAVIAARGRLYYIDDQGWVIDAVEEGGGSSLPRIVDLPLEVKIGRKIETDSLSNAISCLKSLDQDLRNQIASVSVPSSDRLLLYTKDGVEILYGRAEDVEKKNQVIKAILAQKKGGKLIFMDVRTVTNPVVKRLDALYEQ